MYVIKYKDNSHVNIPSVLKEAEGIKTVDEAEVVGGKFMKPDGTFIDMDLIKSVMDASFDEIMMKLPFIYNVFKKKTVVYTGDPMVKTMSTDGAAIYVNPAWAEYIINDDEIGPEGVEFVLVHEAMHILLDHLKRWIENRDEFPDRKKVNWATDSEINYYIENLMYDADGNLIFTPGIIEKLGGIRFKEYGDKGMLWEEIYPLIKLPDAKPPKKHKMSPEWEKGFLDGYTEYYKSLQANQLIEHYVI